MKKVNKIIVAIFIFIFFIVSFISVKRESLTYDEIVYLQEGIITLKDHKFANFDTINPPFIRELATIPYVFQSKDAVLNNISLDKMMPARVVIILLSIALLILIYLTAKSFFGQKVALFSLFLFIFEPNILANNHYFTLDIGVSLFFFLSYLFFLKVIKKASFKNFAFLGISTGLAMGSKLSSVSYLLIVVPIIIFINFKNRSFGWFIKSKKYIFLSIIFSLVTLWAIYFFQSSVIVANRDDSNRVSSKVLQYAKSSNNKILESTVYFLQNQKIPLGYYLAAIKNSIVRSRQENQSFFMGNFYINSKWYFMPVNFFLKIPIPLFIFVLISFVLFIKKKAKDKKYLLFFIPFILILLISSFSNMNPWVRYLLPLYPFMIIVASISINFFNKGYLKLTFAILCLWYFYGTVSYFPHFISFTNELSGERNKRYEKFIDSNIDWGQSLFDFKNYIEIQKPKTVMFSYFGRDNGDLYGLKSDFSYGSHKFEDICKFHKILKPEGQIEKITAISISNWYYCGYYKNQKYSKEKIVNVVGDSILIFK